MQELGRHKPFSVRPPILHGRFIEARAFERAEPGPAVQLIARDAFVSETAIKLDQVMIEIKSVGRDLELIKSDIAELREEATQNFRFSQMIDREHKARSSKLDDICRRFDYLKSRFDALDGNPKGDYYAFRSLDDVSRRLTELGSLERDFRDVSWKLKLSAGLFSASVFVWLLTLLAF